MRTWERSGIALGILLASAILLLGVPGQALAQCGPFTDAGAECQVSGTVTTSGSHVIGKTLHVLSGGTIKVSPVSAGLNLDIAGDLIIEAGGKINGNVDGNQPGATIVVTAAGEIVLKPGNPGGIITANQNHGSCTANGGGGNISLTAGGNVTTGAGSEITSISPCGKGKIDIAGVIVNLGGLVLSQGTTSKGQGGPINVIASCDLIETGEVTSLGRDPGADRVHLQAGCTVRIFGLVRSEGQGHSSTTTNICRGAERPDKPDNSRACVEIWSGDTVLIDAQGSNKGEVHATVGFGGGVSGHAWIDIFALNDITINGPFVEPFAVHSNMTLSNGTGGTIQVKSKAGNVNTGGLAIQANATNGGGAGGIVLVQGAIDVNFSAATIEAKGANKGGGHQSGGEITARAFNGVVSGVAPGRLDADGGGGQSTPDPGVVTLQGCGTPAAGDGVNYSGTVVPAPAVILADQCGGEPAFAAYVVFPACACACVCVSAATTAAGQAGPTTSITGTGLKQVTDVYLNSTTCDPGFGDHFPKATFLLQTDTLIRVPGSLTSGLKIVTVGPNGSCCMIAP